MAQQLPSQRNRIIGIVLVGLGLTFEVAAALVAVGSDWFSTFGVVGLVGPLVLVVPIFLAKTRASAVVALAAVGAFATVAGIAALVGLISPLAAVGPLIALSFVWVLGLVVIVCVSLMERPRHARPHAPREPSNSALLTDAYSSPLRAQRGAAKRGR